MSTGVQFWYYTKRVPARAVAVAKIAVQPFTAAQLTSANNTIVEEGTLGIWKASTGYGGSPTFTVPDFNVPFQISGDSAYYLSNQFFQLTHIVSGVGTPLFFQHVLPVGVTNVTVVDLLGNTVVVDSLIAANIFYHSLGGAAYYIRYVTQQGYLTNTLLRYDPVMTTNSYTAGGQFYQFAGRLLTIGSAYPVWIRFTKPNGFQVIDTYGYLPNTPWYARIRFGIQPPPIDWSLQRFSVAPGYLVANYVPGTVLGTNLLEFERKNLYYDPNHLPDILIFDKNNVIKYALDGSSPNFPLRKGTIYNWKRGAIQSVDPTNARVAVAVAVEPTDLVFAFYNYYEPDIVYTDLDINPFTNLAVKNKIIEFYAKFDGTNPQQNIYYQILDQNAVPISGATNDPSPGTGTATVFATLVVGATVSSTNFSFTDVRQRGGGLAPQYQSIPQATSFFDLGYWDGKPYPIGGALAVYLPLSILDTLSRSEVQGKINATIPMGALAVVRYFDDQGQEFV